MAHQTLDCKNLNCPMPIVKVSRTFKSMQIGDSLEVEATDPAFKADIEAWARKTGNEIAEFNAGDVQKVKLIKTTE